MEHIRQTLPGVIKTIEQNRRAQAEATLGFLQDSLSAGERKHVKCVALHSGVLTVNVDSSAWLYQLSLKKEGLLKKSGLKNIRFRIGEIK
jgi:predicted nucleic acid-binding Zn ribbon protein